MIAMPTPSRFRERERRIVLAALQVGASRNTAAALARIAPSTLHRWLERGATASQDSRFREFRQAVLQAETAPRTSILAVPDVLKHDPDLHDAWRIVDREWSLPPLQDWRPPEWDDLAPARSVPGDPIKLTFHDGTPIGGPPRAG
jgi:hypothetical protein